MARFGSKKHYTEYLYTKPVVFLLGILTVLLGHAVYDRYVVAREMAQRQAETEKTYTELLEKKEYLKKKVDYLSGTRGIEEEIRKHFDVAQEGEQVVILVGDEKDEEAQAEKPLEKPRPWYKFW